MTEGPKIEDPLQKFNNMLLKFEEELTKEREKPLTAKETEMLFYMVNWVAERSIVYFQEILLENAGTIPTPLLLFAIARLEFVMQCYTYRNTVKDKFELLREAVNHSKTALLAGN